MIPVYLGSLTRSGVKGHLQEHGHLLVAITLKKIPLPPATINCPLILKGVGGPAPNTMMECWRTQSCAHDHSCWVCAFYTVVLVLSPWVWPELSPYKPSTEYSPQGVWRHSWRAGHCRLECRAAGIRGWFCKRVLPACACLWQSPGPATATWRTDLRCAVWWFHASLEVPALLLLLALFWERRRA